MNYKETGFRAFYHHFVSLPLTEKTANCLEGFPDADKANGYLAYGYIDHECGLSLHVLAAARASKNGIKYFEPANDLMSVIRIGAVEDDPFRFEPDEDGSLSKQYGERVSLVNENYYAGEDIETTRSLTFLDASRHEYYIDDVLVHLLKEGNRPDGCWARIIGLQDHVFIGKLLNEPYQDFGVHKGEDIAFVVTKNDEDKIICVSNMTIVGIYTEEELADGKMLEDAVHKFVEDKNTDNFSEVLMLLRDSYVLVPCNAVMSDEDQAELDAKFAGKTMDERNALLDEDDIFVAKGQTRLIPDILESDGKYYFPIFSSEEAMGEYGRSFSKIAQNILDIIPIAKNNEKEISGIVLNAFGENFVLDREVWDVMEKIQSRIKRTED